MIIAQERPKLYGDLLSRIYGIVFLGTPHRGADVAWWATFAAGVLKTVQLGRGTNTAYIEQLKRNSAEFSHIPQQWIERSEAVLIRTFYETERLSGTLVGNFCPSGPSTLLKSCQVFDKSSARLGLPNEIAIGLAGSNHRTICKFEEAKSQRYRPVWNALKEMARSFVGNISSGILQRLRRNFL